MSEYVNALMLYLKEADPDEWHKVALGWNWDNGVKPLAWIAQQPQCDKGTALLIYWQGGAGFYAQYEGHEEDLKYEREYYDLQKAIKERYLSGFYTRQEIAFDPRDDLGSDWTNDYEAPTAKQPIPKEMLKATSGREVKDTHSIEGFPQEVTDEVEN